MKAELKEEPEKMPDTTNKEKKKPKAKQKDQAKTKPKAKKGIEQQATSNKQQVTLLQNANTPI